MPEARLAEFTINERWWCTSRRPTTMGSDELSARYPEQRESYLLRRDRRRRPVGPHDVSGVDRSGYPGRCWRKAPTSCCQVVQTTVGDYTDLKQCALARPRRDHLRPRARSHPVAGDPGGRGRHDPSCRNPPVAQDKAAMRRILTERLGAPCPTWRVRDAWRAGSGTIGCPSLPSSRERYDGHGWKIDSPAGVTEPYQDLTANSASPSSSSVSSYRIRARAFRNRRPGAVRTGGRLPDHETVQDRACACSPSPGSGPERSRRPTAPLTPRHRGRAGCRHAGRRTDAVPGRVGGRQRASPCGRTTRSLTLGGAHTSQPENHLRQSDLPLGDPAARTPWVVMHNVLGEGSRTTGALLHCFACDPRLRIELYGKPVTRAAGGSCHRLRHRP